MKRILTILAVSAFMITTVGCGKDSKQAPAAAPKENQEEGKKGPEVEPNSVQDNTWKLSYSDFRGTPFYIAQGGTFEVSSGSQVLSGILIKREMDSVTKHLVNMIEAPGVQMELPMVQVKETQTADYTLTLVRNGKSNIIVQVNGKNMLAHPALAEDAVALEKAILAVVKSHYSTDVLLPNACLEDAKNLDVYYASVASCKEDKDCSLVDVALNPIPTGTSQGVRTDSCTWIKPLSAANPVLIADKKLREALIGTLANITASCKVKYPQTGIAREKTCTPTTFSSLEGKAFCETTTNTCSVKF